MAGFLDTVITGDVTGQDLLIVAGATLTGSIVGSVVDGLNRAAAKRSPDFSVRRAVLNALDGPLRWIVVAAALAASIDYVTTAADLRAWQGRAFFVAAMPFALWFGLSLNSEFTKIWAHRADGTESSFDDQLVPVVRTAVRVAMWAVAVLLVVQNLGGEVSSLLAGFGLGGLAVAMASKDTLANLFGSLVIFIDRPFVVGDWVEIDDYEGVVEEVGLRVTRIRTFAKSLITIPNATLTTSAINNWSKMHKRRIKMTVGITYDADAAKVEQAVAAMRDALETVDGIERETGVIYLDGFGASSLDIFVYCFAESPDWEGYLATKEALMLQFMRRLDGVGAALAFPTRTVHLVHPQGAAEKGTGAGPSMAGLRTP